MYTPYTWTTGEVITAEKLNNLEQGVEDSEETSLPVTTGLEIIDNLDDDTIQANKTYSEILDSNYSSGVVRYKYTSIEDGESEDDYRYGNLIWLSDDSTPTREIGFAITGYPENTFRATAAYDTERDVYVLSNVRRHLNNAYIFLPDGTVKRSATF